MPHSKCFITSSDNCDLRIILRSSSGALWFSTFMNFKGDVSATLFPLLSSVDCAFCFSPDLQTAVFIESLVTWKCNRKLTSIFKRKTVGSGYSHTNIRNVMVPLPERIVHWKWWMCSRLLYIFEHQMWPPTELPTFSSLPRYWPQCIANSSEVCPYFLEI